MLQGKGCLNLISGFATAPSSTYTTVTNASGDSTQVKNAPKAAYLVAAWGDWQTAGDLRITSPRLANGVTGITLSGVASVVQPLMRAPQSQVLVPQDNLTVALTGSATAGDIESYGALIYYPSLPGSDGTYLTYSQLMAQMVNVVTVKNTLALGTAGGYSGEEAINAEEDYLIANTRYALMGYLTTAECCSIGWRGPDTGNVRVGGPGCDENKEITRNWFVDLARATGSALIPVINWSNAPSTLIDGVQDENGTDVTVTSIFAQLR